MLLTFEISKEKGGDGGHGGERVLMDDELWGGYSQGGAVDREEREKECWWTMDYENDVHPICFYILKVFFENLLFFKLVFILF